MRFIRKYRGQNSFTVRPGLTPEDAFRLGLSKAQSSIRMRWQHAGKGLTPWELEAAGKHFLHKGTAIGENPVNRLTFLDTELEEQLGGWSLIEQREGLEPGAIRKLAEERLLSSPSFGVDFIRVEDPKAPVPYAKYLDHRKVQGRRTVEHAVQDIVGAITAVGIDASLVLAYERDNPDQHSEAIIAAVEALSGEPEPTPLMAA